MRPRAVLCVSAEYLDARNDRLVHFGDEAVRAGDLHARGDLVHNVHAAHDVAEHGEIAVEIRRVVLQNKELAGAAVLIRAARHADGAARHGERVVEAVGGELALHGRARLAGAVLVRAAAVNGEAVDDAVNGQVVIKALFGEIEELGRRFGRAVRVHLEPDSAVIVHGDLHLVLAGPGLVSAAAGENARRHEQRQQKCDLSFHGSNLRFQRNSGLICWIYFFSARERA